MLKFSKTDDYLQTQCVPNLLPCRIHHEGPVDASPRYWAPERAKGNIIDGKLESYFRGRKLRGQELDLPQGYRGVIVKEAGKEKTAPQSHDKGDIEGEEGEEEQEEVTMLEEVGSFEKMVIWNHESMVNGDDAFVKGVSEWIGFAEAVRLPITYPESITVADKTHRPDACTSRKDFVKMDIESFRFLQCELKAQKVATCP